MANPRKEAAENISRRAAEKEAVPLTATVRRYRPVGEMEVGRSMTVADLTPKAKREWLTGKTGRGTPFKKLYTELSNENPERKSSQAHGSPIDWWLQRQKGLNIYNRYDSVKKLIKKGILKSSILPEFSARVRAAGKVLRKKRLMSEARQRPLKDVATKDMTAEERREWSKRQKK